MRTLIINSKKYGRKEVFLDDEDFDRLSKFTWWIFKPKNIFYAMRKTAMRNNVPGKNILMHRDVLCVTDNEILVDHKDRNGLNCQRINLRKATLSQNGRNRVSATGSASKYLGVSLLTIKTKNKKGVERVYEYWRADIKPDKKGIYLGTFKTEEAAAIAYNEAAVLYHKEFARPNIL